MRDGGGAPAREPGTGPLDPLIIRVMQWVGATAGGLYLMEPDGQSLRLVLLSGLTPEIVAPWRRIPLEVPVPATDAVRQRRLIWIGTYAEFAQRYPRAAIALPYPFVVSGVPIIGAESVWGALVLMWPTSRSPRLAPRELDAIDTICQRMGAILDRAAEHGHPMRPPEEPRTLSMPRSRLAGPDEAAAAIDFTERLPEGCCALNLDGRITFVNETATELLGLPRERLLGTLPREALPWLDEPAYEDRYRAAVVSHRPTAFTARRPPDRWLRFELFPDSSGISVRISPTVVGAMTNVAESPPRSPVRVSALYHIMHLAAALTEAVGVQDVVELVANQIMPAFDAQGLVLLVVDSGRLRVTGIRGYEDPDMIKMDPASLRAPSTPAEQAMTKGTPTFIGSPQEGKQRLPGLTEMSPKSAWAFLPLIVSGRPVGCCVLSYDRPHTFNSEERAVLNALAGLIAQALDRARLYDAKHQLAHGLQASLLPAVLPKVSGLEVAARYLPATRGLDIGGDFYDLIRLDGSTAAAVIGDVQGHNVTAAALMGQVRTAVHAHATAGAGPGEVLAHTNRLLTDINPGLFTSCLYAHIDLEERKACLASAGHPPPILRHGDEHADVVEVMPGLLLGIEPDTEYPTVEVPLPDNAVLALYTDGLVESPDVDLEESIAALAGALARSRYDSMESLADTLLEHRGSTESFSDDIALLLLCPLA